MFDIHTVFNQVDACAFKYFTLNDVFPEMVLHWLKIKMEKKETADENKYRNRNEIFVYCIWIIASKWKFKANRHMQRDR